MKRIAAIAMLMVAASLSAETEGYITPVGVWGDSPLCSFLPVFCPLQEAQYALIICEDNPEVSGFDWSIEADGVSLAGAVERSGRSTTVLLPSVGELHNVRLSVVPR